MSLQNDMENLEIAINQLSQGINAFTLMTMGLLEVQDPYADGFNALNTYLIEADRAVHKYLTPCTNAI